MTNDTTLKHDDEPTLVEALVASGRLIEAGAHTEGPGVIKIVGLKIDTVSSQGPITGSGYSGFLRVTWVLDNGHEIIQEELSESESGSMMTNLELDFTKASLDKHGQVTGSFIGYARSAERTNELSVLEYDIDEQD